MLHEGKDRVLTAIHLLQFVRLTAGAQTARTNAFVTTVALVTVCLVPVCVPRATQAPTVKTGVQRVHTASDVSTAACVSMVAHANTTQEPVSAKQALLVPSVRHVSFKANSALTSSECLTHSG